MSRLLGQSYQNLEIIAVNDGSSDNSLSILQKMAADSATKGARLKVLTQKNAGAAAARNAGLATARGDYVMFVDADDDVATNFVEKMVRAMTHDTALAVCGIRFNKMQSGETVDAYLASVRKQRNMGQADYVLWLLARDGRMYSSVNKIFRLEIVQKFGLKFEEGRDFAEDTKFVLDYLKYALGEIKFVLEPLYIYNFGTENSTVKRSSTLWANWEKSYDDLRAWVGAVNDGKLGLRTWLRLRLVRLRWRISHYRATKRIVRVRA